MTRYIVTGAAGHLGSTVVRVLLERNAVVRGLLLPHEQPAVPGAEYIHGDVLKPESLYPLFQRVKDERLVVIHTAGLIDVTGEMSRRLYDVNVTGTKNVLALCAKYQVEKLVYVSSVHAIPETGQPTLQTEITEFSPETVVGDYAKTKAEATQAVLDAAANGLPAVVLHPSGIIGPYDEGRNHLVQMVWDFSGGYHEIREILGLGAVLCGKKVPPTLPMPLARLAEPVLGAMTRKRGQRPQYPSHNSRYRSMAKRIQTIKFLIDLQCEREFLLYVFGQQKKSPHCPPGQYLLP